MATIPDNPFRKLRTKLGISQYELARRTGLSKHAILRLEQGCYSEPLPSVINYFVAHFAKSSTHSAQITRPQLEADYREFQYAVRYSNAGLLGHDLPLILDGLPVGIHPLTYLREGHGLNPTELAKRLCISQSTIVYFEKRSINQQTVPAQLISALHDAEYDTEDTDALVDAYAKYRTWLKAEKKLTLVS